MAMVQQLELKIWDTHLSILSPPLGICSCVRHCHVQTSCLSGKKPLNCLILAFLLESKFVMAEAARRAVAGWKRWVSQISLTAVYVLSCGLYNPFTRRCKSMEQRLFQLRQFLATGVRNPLELRAFLGISQPTLSRALNKIREEIITIGKGRSIHYALRDTYDGVRPEHIYRVGTDGEVELIGTLTPVQPEGFVIGSDEYGRERFDGLPWWLYDMRPQGYLGRAYASAYAEELDLPNDPKFWSEKDVIKALALHGHDATGNLLIGEGACEDFMNMTFPVPVNRQLNYPAMARAASDGEIPGSSAGGEQPKFCTYTDYGHVIVKFTIAAGNQISERWADLLLAEHIALDVLGVPTYVFDFGDQRFLEIPRFDRVGVRGRVGMLSLEALNLEFVGAPPGHWPTLVKRLAQDGHVRPEACDETEFRWAFGRLIGNTDMHRGNLSFVTSGGRPYSLSPAYDILPMCFSPKTSGEVPDTLTPIVVSGHASQDNWIRALEHARVFLEKIRNHEGFSDRFRPCIDAIAFNIGQASIQINTRH